MVFADLRVLNNMETHHSKSFRPSLPSTMSGVNGEKKKRKEKKAHHGLGLAVKYNSDWKQDLDSEQSSVYTSSYAS